jgi:hypothetical protein
MSIFVKFIFGKEPANALIIRRPKIKYSMKWTSLSRENLLKSGRFSPVRDEKKNMRPSQQAKGSQSYKADRKGCLTPLFT